MSFGLVFFFFFLIQPPFLWRLTTPDMDDIFLPVSVAHDAIAVEEVKLQFLIASDVSFVFSFPKVTLSIMQ